MTTTKMRKQARELVRDIIEKPDQEEITLSVGAIKNFISLVRDYAVLTQATDAEAEIATVVESLIEYVDINEFTSLETTQPVIYRTTQLAEIFGVSVTAINNWIAEERFIDYKRKPNKHARIPHNTKFRHRDGHVEPLGHVVKRYMNEKHTSFADEDERAMLVGEIDLLRQKYGGRDFEEAFNLETLTPEEESDLSRWRFYRSRLAHLS